MEPLFSKEEILPFLEKSEDELLNTIYNSKLNGEIIGGLFGGVGGAMAGARAGAFGKVIFGSLMKKVRKFPSKEEIKNNIQQIVCTSELIVFCRDKENNTIEFIAAVATILSAFYPASAAIAGGVLVSKIGLITFCKNYKLDRT